MLAAPVDSALQFLSTPSARRATAMYANRKITGLFLSTPSARRATIRRINSFSTTQKFLSTPSARRATHISLI